MREKHATEPDRSCAVELPEPPWQKSMMFAVALPCKDGVRERHELVFYSEKSENKLS